MDLSLFFVALSLFAIEAAFYFWHEPKIEGLEEKRRAAIDKKVKQILERNVGGNSLESILKDYLYTAFDSDKDIIMPVGSPTPHKKIFLLLLTASFLSIIYGPLKGSPYDWEIISIWKNTFVVYLSGVFAFVTILFFGVSIWLGIDEFRYVRGIKEKFKR